MSTLQTNLLIVLPLLCLIGCGPSQYLITPKGDLANIKTRNGLKFAGELLCIQDSSLYVVRGEPKGKVIQLAVSDIESIEIEGYANRRWVISVLLFQAVPAVLLTIAAASGGGGFPAAVFFVFSNPPVLTYILFEASTPPPPQSANPKMVADIQHLSKYCRFPQGLTDAQFQMILQSYNQAVPERLY